MHLEFMPNPINGMEGIDRNCYIYIFSMANIDIAGLFHPV